MNVSVLYYDDNTPKDLVKEAADRVIESLNDTKVLVLPKNFDLLLNCSIDQLVSVRSVLDAALAVKLQESQQFQQELCVKEDISPSTECKIIDITQYLS